MLKVPPLLCMQPVMKYSMMRETVYNWGGPELGSYALHNIEQFGIAKSLNMCFETPATKPVCKGLLETLEWI